MESWGVGRRLNNNEYVRELCNQPTPQSRVRRQKLTVPKLVWQSPAFSGTPKFGPSLVLTLSQINPVHTLLHSCLNTYSAIMPSKRRKNLRSVSFVQISPVGISVFPYTCHMPSPSHLPWFYVYHNITKFNMSVAA